MKNERVCLRSGTPGLHQVLRTMKIAFVFVLLTCSQLSASVWAQRVSVELKNASLREIFEQVKLKTGVSFMYSNDDVKNFQRKDFRMQDADVREIMEACLKGTGLTFELTDNVVVVRRADALPQTPEKVELKGVVKDKAGEPLPGVAVMVKGTTIGVITDINGVYALSVPKMPDMVLVFSFVGMAKQEIAYTGQKELNVVMEAEATEMDEVVVNGIFTRKANSFTGSVVTMTKDKLLQVSNQNVFQSLKNLDPSLMIFDNMEFGSDPNRMPKMQLRGTSSFDLSSEGGVDLKGTYGSDPNAPLFILDGFEATVEKIMDLDMNRIESLTILKDASAKAIYGSKAANGVVVIETKKTTEGDLRVTYTGSVDLSLPDLSSYDLANALEKLQIEKEAGLYETDEYDPVQQVELNQKYNRILTSILSGVNTDWMAKPLRTGVGNKHTLSVELGSNNLRVIADLSYNKVRGVMRPDRTTTAGSLMVSYRHKKLNFRNILTVTANESNDSPYGSFDEYARLNPYYSPYDQNGILVQNMLLQFNSEDEVGTEFIANPLYNASLNTLLQQQYIDVTNNSYIEWMIIDGLKATGRLGITEKRTKADEFYPANHLKFRNYSEEDFFRRGTYQINEGDSKTLTADLNVNWSKQFGEKHFVFGNVGYNVSETSYQEDIYNAEGFPNDKMNNIVFARQFTKDSKPMGTESTSRELGFLAAANYTYDNRFLFDGSYRASASSMFGKNRRWGQFWSVASVGISTMRIG